MQGDGMQGKTDKKTEEICRLSREGKSRKQIAEEMYCSMSTVDRALHLYGDIPVRDNFEDHKEEIMEMYQAGETLKMIAEKTGISVSTINRHLLDMGMRRGSGWKPGHEKQAQRKPMNHREQRDCDEESEILTPRRYADNRRRSVTVVIHGKVYQDVSAWYM